MGEKLRACDCGAEDSVEVHAVGFEERGATGEYQTAYGGFAQCTKCRRRGPNGAEAASYDEAIAAAVTAWNYRPVEDALRTALVGARAWIGTRSTAIRFDHFADTETCIHCHMALDTIGGRERHASDCSRQKALAAIDAALEVKA